MDVPLLELEGDCVDPDDGSGAQNPTRLEAMIEMRKEGERVLAIPSKGGRMRVLLVQPGLGESQIGFRNLAVVEPLGLETVAGALKGHEVRLLDLRFEDSLSQTLEQFRPQVCGISCSFTLDYYRALSVANEVKANPSAAPFVVIGGHHATLNPDDFNRPSVDAVVIGEGEVTMPELLDALERGEDPRRIPGLAINYGGEQIRTGVRKLIENLDEMPMPERRLAEKYRARYYLHVERPAALVETARGCPYHCNFCSVWRFYRGKVRMKSPARVVEEVSSIKARYILFTDDNFLADIERARQIGTMLRDRGAVGRYAFQARSDSIVEHPEIILLWKELGLVGVFVGVEKIDDDGLSAVNKDNSARNNEQALEFLRRHGVGVTASFIIDPNWCPADFNALRRYVQTLRIETPSFSVLTPLPGTLLYREFRDRLQTHNYELFDLLHAVVPTRLPLPEFYRELAGLYRSCYSWRKLSLAPIELVRRALHGHGFSLIHVLKLISAGRTVSKPNAYLGGHNGMSMPLTEA